MARAISSLPVPVSLKDAEIAKRFDRLIDSFMALVEAGKFYSDVVARARSQLVLSTA
jgi:hypothetical protein